MVPFAVLAVLSFVVLIVVAALLAGCARPQAQPAEPPPPQVTVAEALDRDVTEWDEFTGRLEAVEPSRSGRACPASSSAVHFTEGAVVRRASCCSRSIRGRSRPKSIACARS